MPKKKNNTEEKTPEDTVVQYGWVCCKCGKCHSPYKLTCDCVQYYPQHQPPYNPYWNQPYCSGMRQM